MINTVIIKDSFITNDVDSHILDNILPPQDSSLSRGITGHNTDQIGRGGGGVKEESISPSKKDAISDHFMFPKLRLTPKATLISLTFAR